MKHEKFNRILGAASITVMLGIASVAQASTATPSPSYCPASGENAAGISLDDVTYRGANATSCYGVVGGNINEHGASAINALNWGSGWTYLDGTDSLSSSYGGISFTMTSTVEEQSEGTWRLTATDTNGSAPLNLPATFDLTVALKAGDQYALWYYDNAPVYATNDGKWEIEFKQKAGKKWITPGLSHMVVFGSYDTPTVYTPVPAAAWLLGSGLIGLVGIARRKDAARSA